MHLELVVIEFSAQGGGIAINSGVINHPAKGPAPPECILLHIFILIFSAVDWTKRRS